MFFGFLDDLLVLLAEFDRFVMVMVMAIGMVMSVVVDMSIVMMVIFVIGIVVVMIFMIRIVMMMRLVRMESDGCNWIGGGTFRVVVRSLRTDTSGFRFLFAVDGRVGAVETGGGRSDFGSSSRHWGRNIEILEKSVHLMIAMTVAFICGRPGLLFASPTFSLNRISGYMNFNVALKTCNYFKERF